jgi:hypothetical protein
MYRGPGSHSPLSSCSRARFLRILSGFLLNAIVLASVWANAQQAPHKADDSLPPGVEVRIDAVPRTATVGDLIQIELDLALPPGYQAKIPRPAKETGDFSIIDFVPGSQIPRNDSLPQPERKQGSYVQRYRARISAAVYKTGTFVFPPLPILLRTEKGTEIEVSSPPVSITIQSVLRGADQNLKDLKKQAEIREPRRWFVWISLLAAASIVSFVLWRFWQRRRHPLGSFSPRPGPDALEVASADLHRLLAQGLPEPGREKQFYVLLSQIAKRIMEIGYRIHTAEQTTSEIVSSLRGSHQSAPESLEQIESFLLRCDMVKFAKYVPSASEQEAVCADALGILKAVVSRQSPVASEQDSTNH